MTEQIKILTAVTVLPLHDMRTYAGELVCADIFTDGRLMLGVGRGAYAFEIERLGVPMEETRDRFNESLDVLQALLSEEEARGTVNFIGSPPSRSCLVRFAQAAHHL